ncbi:phospholipid phosphatase [Sphingobium sp. TomTYG75]
MGIKPKGSFMRRLSGVLLGAVLSLCPGYAMASPHGWSQASNIARTVVVASALGLPTVNGDWKGTLQAGESVGAAYLISEGLKQTFPEMRPDGSNRHSFPSAHTATAFAAAASLQNRYGWQVGVPAQLVAAFVGVARVEGKKHHWFDVAAGMAIGEASGFLLTGRKDDNIRIFPWAAHDGAGASLALRF